MITPSFGLTATERVLPKLVLDWTTGLAQSGVDVTRAGVATFVGSNGLIQSATADTQRVDYVTGTAGLLVEESRSNTALQSEDFSAASWVLGSADISVSTDQTEAPDGNATADKIADANTNLSGARFLYQQIAATAGQSYTYSVFAKKSDYDWLALQFQSFGSFSGARGAYYNLVTGEVGTVSGTATTAGIQDYGNGWYRIWLTSVADVTSAARCRIYMAENNNVLAYTGTTGYGTYIWGAQLEAGAFATSYIPTEATAVTRNADLPAMTGTNFSDWFNPTEGTFFVQTLTPVGASGAINRLLSANDGSTSNRIEIDTGTGTATVMRVNATTAQVNMSAGTVGDFETRRSVFAYKQDDCALAMNASAVSTDTSATMPTVDRLLIGASFATGSSYANGLIQKVLYWPHRLTNAEIQAFSK